MKLPASLAPWANILRIFPDEISLILGNYAQKISPFVSPLNSLDTHDDGEPNGYDGVARRGIYERLLLSELALADEFGDEFVRRAVMGEHLFLNLAKIAPAAKRVSVALFDAGPMQLGTPRIAHLAVLIVLARRAEAAGATFLCGVLQDAQQLVVSDDTAASIQILLESRTAADVSSADFAAWREKLSDIPQKSDVWLIGGANLAQFEETKGFSHLFVDDVLEPQKNELALKIKSASGTEKQLTLELPPANVCTRLLRNPFETAKTPEFTAGQISGRVTNFFFDQKGARLFARLSSSDVLSFVCQNKPGTGKTYPTIYRPERAEKYFAVGSLRRAVGFLSLHDYQTVRLSYRKRGFSLKEGLYQIDATQFKFPENESDLLQVFSLRPQHFHYDEAAVLDAAGNLFLLKEGRTDFGADTEHLAGFGRTTATNVLAVAQTDKEFIFVGCEDGDDVHHLVSISKKIERKQLPVKQIVRAVFGRGERGKKVLALESAEAGWTILNDDDFAAPQRFEPQGEVVGVYQDARFAPAAGLFELMTDRRTLEFSWERGRRKRILTANDDIAKIEFNPRSPLLAYQTVGGELVIFSLTHQAAIGHYSK